MTAPSTATRTFLFTDIEGSTRRWEAFPAAMREALARHDTLLRAAIEDRGGSVFKTVGDAFCAVFADPAAALAAAVAGQRALAAEPWQSDIGGLRVRMALHAGTADERDGDYFGPVLNRVSRLLAAGHGGQVLVSLAVHEAVAGGGAARGDEAAGGTVADGGATVIDAGVLVPAVPDLTFRDLGEHRLKDLTRPEHVYQLLAPGLAADFPPILSLDTHPNNLPRQASSFVGRAVELAKLLAQLEHHPVVTLVGVGGSGKTRLAVQVAAEALHRYKDGAWFVDLAPLRDEAQVFDAAAAVLDPANDMTLARVLYGAGGAEHDLDERARAIAARIRGRRLLIVLDNCEHLLTPCAALAAALAQYAPGATVLTTSRAPLRIPDEVLWHIEPLTSPDPADLVHDPDPVATVSHYDAVRLFVDRAAAVLPAFRVTRANAAAVAEICHRLDGIPLAIELAAARLRVLTPAQLTERLDQRFWLLTGGSRTALPRQQTLRALIDWSYDLLAPGEQRALQNLSILAGALPVEGALAVIGEEEGPSDAAEGGVDALDALESLLTSSLVVSEERDDGRWFRLLDTIRAYAAERLGAVENGDPARARLLRWLLEVTPDEIGMVADHRQEALDRRLAPVFPSVRILARWAAEKPEHCADATLLAARLWWIWGPPGLRNDDLVTLSALIAAEEPIVRAGDADARRIAAQAMLLFVQGNVALPAGYANLAGAAFGLSQVRFQAVGDWIHDAWARQGEGLVCGALGDLATALARQVESVNLKRAHGASAVDVAFGLNNVGVLQLDLGEIDQAAAAYREGIGLLGDLKEGPYWSLVANLAQVHARRGETDLALAACREVIAGPEAYCACWALVYLARAEADRGRPRRAAAVLGATQRAFEEQEIEPGRTEVEDLDHAEARARAELSPQLWASAWHWGHGLDPGARRAFAVSDDDPDVADSLGGDGSIEAITEETPS